MISTLFSLFYIYVYVNVFFPFDPSQLVNLPEPVTLDFLDAEVEDSNKEEVSTQCIVELKSFWFSGVFCSLLLLSSCANLLSGQRTNMICLRSLTARVTCFHNMSVVKISFCVYICQIRRQMIDGRPGDMQIKTLIKSIDEASQISLYSVNLISAAMQSSLTCWINCSVILFH